MKSSYTKRALAFWLAVAMVATSAPMALALEPDTTQPVVWAGTPGEGGEGGGITSLSAEDIKMVTITPSEVTVDGTISRQDIKVEVFTDEDGNPKITENLGWEIVATNGGEARHVTVGADGVVTVDAKAKAGTYTIRPKINDESASKFAILKVKRSEEEQQMVFKIIVSGGQSKLTIPESGSATTAAFTVQFLNAFDEPVTQEKEVKWNVIPASENTGKVTIDDEGVVTVQAGAVEDTVTVTADIEGSTPRISEKATLTLEKAAVTSNEIKEVELSQSKVTVNGSTATPDVTVKAYSDDGKPHDITSQVAWTVETTDGEQGDVTVSQDGKVTVSAKAKAGTYIIKAGAKGSITGSGSATLTVSRAASELKSITEVWNKGTSSSEDVTDGLTLEAKQSAELFVKGLDQYGEEVTVTDEITVKAKSAPSTNLDFAVNKITAKETIQAQTTEYVTVTYDGDKLPKDIKVTVRPAKTVGTEVKFATPPAATNVYGDAITAPTITVDGKPVESGATVRYEYRRVQPNPQGANLLANDVLSTVPKDVGNYQVTAYYDSEDGSKHGSASTTFEITKKPVTVTADNKTITKGDAIPALTFTVPTGALAYNDTKDALGVTLTTKATSTSDTGTYNITGTADSKNYEVKVEPGTLTIKAEEGLRMSASKASDDSNRSRYDLSVRRGTGYLDLNADADDYLSRQTVDGSKDYWIGFDLDVYLDGVSKNIQDLYVSSTGKSSDWKKISDRYIGDFYLDNLSGTSFTLWFDTDDDSDNSDRLYFATSSSGANEYYIDVDFDAYSGSSSSSSGSSSSDTSKVNGDRVSTTTVDKTPSVKNGSATVTFSSSALSDALDANKKEAKREDADKTYIELDVKTSKSVDDTTITVPRSSLDKLADEDTGLKLTTNQGTVTFDCRALAEIYDACDKTNIEFYLEEEDDDQYVLLIKDGSSDVIDLGRGSVEVTFDYKLKSGEKSSDVKVYRIGNGDKTWLSTYGGSTVYGAADVYAAAPTYVTDMKADYSSSKKKVTFTTDALGTFLITTDTLKTGSGNTTTTPTYNAFVDVPSSRWSATYINKLASLGIINGTGGGYFEPTLYVTREEFVKMLAGVAGANVTGYTSSRFPDVPLSRWSAPYIAWAADRGITTGTDGGNFAPTMRITREEMATMIYRYVQSSGKTLPAKNAPVIFADANLISGWAQTPVSVMQQAGIIDGNVTNGRYTFDPKVSASREECAKMLAVLYDLVR